MLYSHKHDKMSKIYWVIPFPGASTVRQFIMIMWEILKILDSQNVRDDEVRKVTGIRLTPSDSFLNLTVSYSIQYLS